MPVKKVSHIPNKETKDSAFDIIESNDTPHIQRKGNTKRKIIIGISLTAIVIFGTSLNLFLHYQKTHISKANSVLSSEVEQESIVSKVGKLIELPNNEAPTIATVSDVTKLQGQPFFQHAKNGDIVLIYTKSNEAILYDPAMDKILEYGPIANSQQTTASSNESVAGAATKAKAISPTSTQLTVALYNGTTITGLTKKIQAQLVQAMPGVTVVQNTNASKQDYKQTIVADLTGKESTAAQQLANILHGKVGNLPPGEVAPSNANTDLVVILGTTN